MYKAPLLCLALATAVACHKEDVLKAPEAPAKALGAAYPHTWRLVKLSGPRPGAVLTGAALPWQETYVFRADSTFTKTRRQGPQVVEARGTFSLRRFSDGPYAVLTYAAATPILASCTPSAGTEALAFHADGTLVSTWQACDGPRLEYQQVE